MHVLTVGGVPAVLWTPAGDRTPALIFIGHGGGQHKQHPAVLHRAQRFVAEGFAVVSADVPNHGDRAPDEDLNRLAAEVRGVQDLPRFQARAAERIVPEWQAVLDAVQSRIGAGPVGYWGVSLGCGLGVPFVAAEPRIRAAVLGLGGASANAGAAAKITVPVEFLVQWDDERVPREQSLELFGTFGSEVKTLHANPGRHGDRLPEHELDSQVRFFARHLSV